MDLVVKASGDIECIYDETIDLATLGKPVIERASHVEPNAAGKWLADLAPVDGPLLGPFDCRSQALEAERTWLDLHWLNGRR